MKKTGRGGLSKKAAALLFFCALWVLCGCAGFSGSFSTGEGLVTSGDGGASQGKLAQSADSIRDHLSMESAAVLDYAVPTQLPSILVDREGYSPRQTMMAFLKLDPSLEEVPEYFSVVDAESGLPVLQGAFTPIKGDTQAVSALTADFTGKLPEGEYRVTAGCYGSSYPFRVAEGLMQERFRPVAEAMREAVLSRQATPEDVLQLLQSYEWNREYFAAGESAGIPEPLGEAAEWIRGIDYSAIAAEDAAVYAVILAKFGYLYKDRDEHFATECLQKASALYTQSKETLQRGDTSFRALTELYRASGLEDYHREILEETKVLFEKQGFVDESGYLYGIMTYMTTRQTVDPSVCDRLMDPLLSRGEEIGTRKRQMLHPVSPRNNGEADLLFAAQQLICANAVLEGHTYNEILEDILHYLSGRNLESAVYPPEGDHLGAYYLLLSWLAALEAGDLL